MKLDRLLGYDYPTMVAGQRLFHETPGEGEEMEHCCFCGKTEEECTGGGLESEIQAHDFTPGGRAPRYHQVQYLEEDFVVSDCRECARPYSWRLSVEAGPEPDPEEGPRSEHHSFEWVCMCGVRNPMQHLPRPSLEEFVAEMEVSLCAHGCAEVPTRMIQDWMTKLKEVIQNSR